MQSNSPSAHHFEHQPDTQQTQAEELSNSQMPEHKLPDLHTHKSNSTPPNFALHAFRDRFPMLLSLKSHESSRLSPFDYDGFESDDDDVDSPQHESRVDIGSPLYTKLLIENDEMVKEDPRFREYLKASKSILNILGLRDQYIIPQSDYKHIQHLVEMKPPSSEPQINYLKNKHVPKKLENSQLKKVNGVFVPYLNEKPVCVYKTAIEHLADMRHILRETCDQATKAFCHKRLCLLSEKFKLHSLYNREKEFFEQKMNINRDFYNIRKIDNLIDHMASATVKTFVNFVVSRVKDERNMVVATDPETKKPITLEELFEKLQCKSKTITMENLEVQNYLESLRRYNRTGNSPVSVFGRLVGEVFLQRDNMINGKFLAELTKEMFREYETYKFQYSEFRIQVRGKNRGEWKKMAEWFNTHEIYNQHVRWLIQIPRKYEKYRKANVIKNFQEILDNIFEPLFEVTLNPEVDPGLHKFLLTVVGFDTVDDENGYNQSSHPGIFKLYPNQWIMEENPHFCYWAYYLWANIYTLNSLRKLRGLNTFAFRPHVGESGSVERLISVYLLANGISQGTHLNKIPLIQYLFYLKQIGISMTPLSDNKGLLKYKDNPFPDFFAKGLNVSLSTDRPLIHHMTEASLIEEYSISSQVFDLSLADICELARNSVRQCGFEHILKSYWIGDNYATLKANGNDQSKSNVPRARYLYRVETLEEELEELKAIIEVAGE